MPDIPPAPIAKRFRFLAFGLGALFGAAAFYAAGTIGPGAEALGLGAAPASAVVQTNDVVFYHLTAHAANNSLVFTSDPTVLEKTPGLTQLVPELGYPDRGVRNVTMWDAFTVPEKLQDRWYPQPYLHGLREGDRMQTPFVYRPFGIAPVPTLSKSLGPLAREFTLNLDEAYSERNATRSEQDYGPRDGFVVGETIPYMGTLGATVRKLDADVATLFLEAQGEETVRSDAFGFDVRIHLLPDGMVTLEPLLAPGQQFTTAGCGLPKNTLAAGTYKVVGENESEFRFERVFTDIQLLLSEGPMRFTLQVVDIQRPITQQE